MQSLLNLVTEESEAMGEPPLPTKLPGFIYSLGEWAILKWRMIISFLAFVGETATTLSHCFLDPRRIRVRAVLREIEETGYQALPIVALLSFLIGIVLTYQIAVQLLHYGATVFLVDIAGVAMLREFSPLITAIIAAGRTSTAFAAQIGTMKVNEEIDVLHTMGVIPIERLVLPKVIALLLCLTLLTAWSDIFGILGNMVMCRYETGMSYLAYIERFQYSISVNHYWAGLIKAPIFALIIALVGCFQGFQVTRTADSVGQKTTQSAVQSIFLIIVADAFFAVIFDWLGI